MNKFYYSDDRHELDYYGNVDKTNLPDPLLFELRFKLAGEKIN
ncbi:hypothetical protein [Paenibacillus barengoltzii]|jgi:hypothetical protein